MSDIPTGDLTTFTRLSDGTILPRQNDGSFPPMRSETDQQGTLQSVG